MGILDRLFAARPPRFDGSAGRPPSGNGASSFHLGWKIGAGPWDEVSAELCVTVPPSVARLHFWALQVGFDGPRGSSGGGAHLGLQWYPPHPGSTAANWGGYAPEGGELSGGPLAVVSATNNLNTGDFPWRPGRWYRLTVRRGDSDPGGGLVAWAGVIADVDTGEEVVLRELYTRGVALSGPMVWSEVFADCDSPGSEVRWRHLRATAGGSQLTATRVGVNYQRVAEGGCTTTDSAVEGSELVQRTGVTRRTPQGSTLAIV